jgi:hypothetical protein
MATKMTPEQLSEYYDRYNETALLNKDRLMEAVQFINAIFSEDDYKILERVTPEDIEFTYHFLTNRHYTERNEEDILVVKKFRRLTQIIFDHYYPKPNGNTFYHYTKLSALRGILKGELKLTPLIKNENFDEFKTFYKDHNLIGYQTNTDESGKVMEQVLMEQCFAICLAMLEGLTEEKESALWTSFGDTHSGVRIELEIKTEHPDFRKIFYRDKSLDKNKLLLNRLNRDTQTRFNRIFTVAGLSKIGAFYLPGDYNIENEVRFLIKKFTDDYEFNFDDSKPFIMLPLKSDYADISIKRIKAGKKCNLDNLKEIIIENGYNPTDILE